MHKFKIWINAARLRTLPLSLSCVVIGTSLALKENIFNSKIFLFSILTTIALQILSNFANDYGDFSKNTDNENRVGPTRTLQSGLITKAKMKITIVITALISLLFGSILIFLSIENISNILIFYFLGFFAIASALFYTIGKNPYGYSGFGDLFVFIFFGLIGVIGNYFLQTNNFKFEIILPAITIGSLAVGVLNLNNMRDFENDKSSNKNTIVVKIGLRNAKYYHLLLICISILSSFLYFAFFHNTTNLYTMHIMLLSFLILHLPTIFRIDSNKLDSQLKYLALFSFAYSIIFTLQIIILK